MLRGFRYGAKHVVALFHGPMSRWIDYWSRPRDSHDYRELSGSA